MHKEGQTLFSGKNIPNFITSLRLVGTGCLLFIQPLTTAFFVVYTVSGLSDLLDGWIARATNTVSELGAKLDSIADLSFYTVMVVRIFPVLWEVLPRVFWAGLGAVILVRVCSYSLAAVKYRRFASLHTKLNKLSSATVFFVPYVIELPAGEPFCWLVCAIAGTAAVEELIIHIRSKEYPSSPEAQ